MLRSVWAYEHRPRGAVPFFRVRACKKIARGGGAEQYHADKKFKEAAEAAVVACAAQGVPQDAECFICGCSINSMPRSSEGIVRGCACRGTMGLAHLSCLVRQAEMEVKRMEEWNDGGGFLKWLKCFDCGQMFHGVVFHALGWAAWKTYLGRPEADAVRCDAMTALGNALCESRPKEALPVLEDTVVFFRRLGKHSILNPNFDSLAICYGKLGRHKEAVRVQRKVYEAILRHHGAENLETIRAVNNLSHFLNNKGSFAEVLELTSQYGPIAKRVLGADRLTYILLTWNRARALQGRGGSRADIIAAVSLLEDALQRTTRVFGPQHPRTRDNTERLENARMGLEECL